MQQKIQKGQKERQRLSVSFVKTLLQLWVKLTKVMIEGSQQSDLHKRKESDIEEAKKLIQKYFRVLMLLMLFPKYLWGSNAISEIEAISEILWEYNASNVFRGCNTSNALELAKSLWLKGGME